MSKWINVLSLFGGIEGWRIILDMMGVEVANYFSSEIDPYPIKITSSNYSDIVHIGSVTYVHYASTPWGYWFCREHNMTLCSKVDFLIWWPPCQDLSIAWKRAGLEWARSSLFWEYVRILKETKPKVFFMENVASMPAEARAIITEALGVEPMRIDSRLTSAQTRKRLYWCWVRQPDGTYKGIDIPQPEDRRILLKDILEDIPFDAVNDKGDPIWKPLPEKYIAQVQERIEKGNMSLCNVNPSGKWMNWNVTNIEGKIGTLTTNKGEWPKILGQFQIPHGNNTGWLRDSGKAQAVNANGDYANNNKIVAYIPEATKKGYVEVQSGDCVDMAQPQSSTRRGRLCKDKMNALTVSNQIMHIQENELQLYWRPLTVRECARAQSIPDTYSFDAVSKSRAYKGIGNWWELEAVRHQWEYLLPYIL